MHCQSCLKNLATVKVVEPVYEGGPLPTEVRKLDLCAPCAKGSGVPVAGGVLSPSQIVSKLGKFLLKPPGEGFAVGKEVKCPDCGWTLRDFRQTSRFGCPRDYEVFSEFVLELLQRLHGTNEHPSSQFEADLNRLRKQLNEAVGREDYEAAARLRDEIQNLEFAMEEEESD